MKQTFHIHRGICSADMPVYDEDTGAGWLEPSAPEPPISNLRLLKTDSGVPYFCLEVHIPQSVMWLNMAQDVSGWVELETEGMVDSWEGSSAGGSGRLDVFTNNPVPCEPGSFYLYFEIPEKDMTEADVSERCYRYRLRFKYVYSDGQGALQTLTSEWSNQLCNQSESYLGASAWAVPELDMAAEYGLITNAVREIWPVISRGEFAMPSDSMNNVGAKPPEQGTEHSPTPLTPRCSKPIIWEL